jgi:oligopeptide transport system substrate-binding protein
MWENARTGKTTGGTPPDFGSTQWDWGIRTVDASATLDPTFTCGGDRNFGHYCNPAYDKLIAEAVSGIPAQERQAKFEEAQKILYDIVPAVPLYQPRITVSFRNEVQNVRPTPTRIIYFSDLSIKR